MRKLLFVVALLVGMSGCAYAGNSVNGQVTKYEGGAHDAQSVVNYGAYNSTIVPMKVGSDGTVTVSGAVTTTDSVISATGVHTCVAFTASQTAATVYTPTAGKKFVVTDIVISATGAGTMYLFDSTDAAGNYVTPVLSFAANGGCVINFKKPFVSAAVNQILKYTSGSGAAGSILINGYEI